MGKLEVDAGIWAAAAGMSLVRIEAGIAVMRGTPALGDLLQQTIADTVIRYANSRPQDQPAIAATRSVYRALGKDPGRYRPAAEALARRIAQGKGLSPINNIVDINNIVSLETGLSIGSYDAERIRGDIRLRVAGPNESYAGIGRGPLNLEGLPVLVDEEGPFGSPTSDNERSMVGLNTRQLLFVMFDFGSHTLSDAIVQRVTSLLGEYAAASNLAWQRISGDGS